MCKYYYVALKCFIYHNYNVIYVIPTLRVRAAANNFYISIAILQYCNRFLGPPFSLRVRSAVFGFGCLRLSDRGNGSSRGTPCSHEKGDVSAKANNRIAVMWQRYQRLLKSHPVLTNAITAGLIGGTGDLAAQQLEHKVIKKRGGFLPASEVDLARTVKVAGWCLAWLGAPMYFWFRHLDRMFPPGVGGVPKLVQKIAFNQTTMAPFSNGMFFAYIQVSEQPVAFPHKMRAQVRACGCGCVVACSLRVVIEIDCDGCLKERSACCVCACVRLSVCVHPNLPWPQLNEHGTEGLLDRVVAKLKGDFLYVFVATTLAWSCGVGEALIAAAHSPALSVFWLCCCCHALRAAAVTALRSLWWWCACNCAATAPRIHCFFLWWRDAAL